MKPATYELKNHGVTVTISADARRWAAKNFGDLFSLAEEAALKHKAKQPMFHSGIVVEPIEDYATNADRQATGRPTIVMPPHTNMGGMTGDEYEKFEAWKAQKYPAPVSPPPERGAEWTTWGTKVYLYRRSLEAITQFGPSGSRGEMASDWRYTKHFETDPITPAEAQSWLRANGHQSAADELSRLADGEFEPVEAQVVIDDVIVPIPKLVHWEIALGEQYKVVAVRDGRVNARRLDRDGHWYDAQGLFRILKRR